MCVCVLYIYIYVVVDLIRVHFNSSANKLKQSMTIKIRAEKYHVTQCATNIVRVEDLTDYYINHDKSKIHKQHLFNCSASCLRYPFSSSRESDVTWYDCHVTGAFSAGDRNLLLTQFENSTCRHVWGLSTNHDAILMLEMSYEWSNMQFVSITSGKKHEVNNIQSQQSACI